MLVRGCKDGARLLVQLAPKASANEIAGIAAGADGTSRLKVKVTAAPEKGKANKALIKLLAKELDLPKTSMEIVSGPRAGKRGACQRRRYGYGGGPSILARGVEQSLKQRSLTARPSRPICARAWAKKWAS